MDEWHSIIGLSITGAGAFAGIVSYVVRIAQRVKVLETDMGKAAQDIRDVVKEVREDALRRERQRDERCRLDSGTLTSMLERMARMEEKIELIHRNTNGHRRE